MPVPWGYRLIELNNGIQALLVSNLDQKKQKAACSCCVQAGTLLPSTPQVMLIPRLHSAHELQLKFSVMESSIRDMFIFGNWAGAWTTIVHSSKNDNICYIPKTWKTIIHSSKIDDLELYTKYWPWPTYVNQHSNITGKRLGIHHQSTSIALTNHI